MDFTYDLATSRGQVRLLIADTSEDDPDVQIFSDQEIDAFLAMEDGEVKLAASRALKVMAANQVMVLKVIRILDLQTDGASVARELRAAANDLRAEAEEDGELVIGEMVVDKFTYEERLRSQLLRGA